MDLVHRIKGPYELIPAVNPYVVGSMLSEQTLWAEGTVSNAVLYSLMVLFFII